MSRYKPFMIDTKSPAFARMTKAGFDFEIDPSAPPITCFMTCVCGKREFFYFSPKQAVNSKIDVASLAEKVGSASVSHLRDDGYSVDQIRSIRRAFI